MTRVASSTRKAKVSCNLLYLIFLLELGFLLRCLGLKFDPRQVETMVMEFDEDGSGGVELDELEKIIGQIVRISI